MLRDAREADFAVAYIRGSGVRLIRNSLEAIRRRRGTTRILFTTQPPISQASAIRSLMALGVNIRCYRAREVFHIKAYMCVSRSRVSAVLGSANLSASALTQGREWCVAGTDAELPISEMRKEFDRLWNSPFSTEVTDELLRSLEAAARAPEFRAIAAREDQIRPRHQLAQAPRSPDYVVRRRPDATPTWWFQIYESQLNKRARRGDFNVVVICDLDATTEKRFTIPYSYLRRNVLPHAQRDTLRNRYLFTVDKSSFAFRWTGGFRFDGKPFRAP